MELRPKIAKFASQRPKWKKWKSLEFQLILLRTYFKIKLKFEVNLLKIRRIRGLVTKIEKTLKSKEPINSINGVIEEKIKIKFTVNLTNIGRIKGSRTKIE